MLGTRRRSHGRGGHRASKPEPVVTRLDHRHRRRRGQRHGAGERTGQDNHSQHHFAPRHWPEIASRIRNLPPGALAEPAGACTTNWSTNRNGIPASRSYSSGCKDTGSISQLAVAVTNPAFDWSPCRSICDDRTLPPTRAIAPATRSRSAAPATVTVGPSRNGEPATAPSERPAERAGLRPSI